MATGNAIQSPFASTGGGGASLPLTTKGDTLYENAVPAPARLPIGSAGQVLTVSSAGLPAWAAAINPLAASGDGTGATDAANINALLAAGKPVYLIPGETYIVDAPIVMQNQSFLTGWQWNMASQNDFYGNGTGQPTGAIIEPASPGFSGAALISMPDPGAAQMYGVDISGISLMLNDLSSSAGTHGISIIGAWAASFLRGVQIQKAPQDNLHMDVGSTGKVPDDWQITDCKFSAAQSGHGVNVANNLPDSWFDNCESSENTLDGWHINWCDNTRWTACKGENNGNAGWHFTDLGTTSSVMLTGCSTQLNQRDGYLFEGGASSSVYQLTGCRSLQDNQAASTYAGFRAHGALSKIVGTGCAAFSAAYGAYEGSSSYGMWFTGSYLAGTTAATHDDGTNTYVLVNEVPAFNASTITRDQVSNLYTSAGAGTATVTFGTNPTAGATVLVGIANPSGNPSVVDNGTTPTTFTPDVINRSGPGNNIFIYRANNITLPASGGYQITITGSNIYAAAAVSYLNVAAGPPITSTFTFNTGTSVTTNSIATNGLIFADFSDSNATTHTVTLTNASFTEEATSNASAGVGAFAVADWITTATQSSVACTWTLGASSVWQSAIACYAPVRIPTLDGAVTTQNSTLDDSLGNANIAGELTAGSISTTGNVTAGSATVTGAAVVDGNLTVDGTITGTTSVANALAASGGTVGVSAATAPGAAGSALISASANTATWGVVTAAAAAPPGGAIGTQAGTGTRAASAGTASVLLDAGPDYVVPANLISTATAYHGVCWATGTGTLNGAGTATLYAGLAWGGTAGNLLFTSTFLATGAAGAIGVSGSCKIEADLVWQSNSAVSVQAVTYTGSTLATITPVSTVVTGLTTTSNETFTFFGSVLLKNVATATINPLLAQIYQVH